VIDYMKKQFMKVYAARYWLSPKDYDIYCYPSRRAAEVAPHDSEIFFTCAQWKKMGCRIPKGKYPPSCNDSTCSGEVIAVEISAREVEETKR
jgi:hypothetical protein